MVQNPKFPESTDNPGEGQPRRSPWVYIGATVGIIALMVALHLTGVIGGT